MASRCPRTPRVSHPSAYAYVNSSRGTDGGLLQPVCFRTTRILIAFVVIVAGYGNTGLLTALREH
eukprot:2805903-Rhodomonas_salina.1